MMSEAKSEHETTGKITAKNFYDEAWRCRDFELNHLWQRSVFLAAFMLAIAAAYGTLIMKIVFPEASVENGKTCDVVNWLHHLIAMGVCCLGFVFSMLWVMMAKGSKYWFERYEASIDYFVDRYDLNDKDNLLFDFESLNWCEKQEYSFGKSRCMPRHGKLPEKEYNQSLLSTKAGKYSVSRVNCVIGIIGIMVWVVLNVIHGTIFFNLINGKSVISSGCLIFSTIQCLCIFSFLFFVMKAFCSSEEE